MYLIEISPLLQLLRLLILLNCLLYSLTVCMNGCSNEMYLIETSLLLLLLHHLLLHHLLIFGFILLQFA